MTTIPRNERLLNELLEERAMTKFQRELSDLVDDKLGAAERLVAEVDDKLDEMRTDPSFGELRPEIQEQRLTERRQALLDQAEELFNEAQTGAGERVEKLLAEVEPQPVEKTEEQQRLELLKAEHRRAEVADEVGLLAAEFQGATPRKVSEIYERINAGDPDEDEPSERQLLELEAAARWGLQALGDRGDDESRALRRKLAGALRQLRSRSDPEDAKQLLAERVHSLASKTFGARPRRFASRLDAARRGAQTRGQYHKKVNSPSGWAGRPD